MTKSNHIPNSEEYLDHLADSKIVARAEHNQAALGSQIQRALISSIGTMLSALYQASTCHRKCHGGLHVLEALVGRAHNLGAASLSLIEEGYYDEALGLIRSIGEIANLIWLSTIDQSMSTRWMSADKKKRMRDFSPAAVRNAIEKSGKISSHLDSSWYSSLSEGYAHVTPSTNPNSHNTGVIGVIGGQFQQQGLERCTGHLFRALNSITVPIGHYYKFDDILVRLIEHSDELKRAGS